MSQRVWPRASVRHKTKNQDTPSPRCCHMERPEAALLPWSRLHLDLAPSGLVYVERNQCTLHRKPEKDGLLEKGEARLHGVQNSRISDFVEGRQCPSQSIHENKGIYRPQGETLIKIGTRANVFSSLVRTNRSPGAGLARGRSNLQTPNPEAGYRASPPLLPAHSRSSCIQVYSISA